MAERKASALSSLNGLQVGGEKSRNSTTGRFEAVSTPANHVITCWGRVIIKDADFYGSVDKEAFLLYAAPAYRNRSTYAQLLNDFNDIFGHKEAHAAIDMLEDIFDNGELHPVHDDVVIEEDSVDEHKKRKKKSTYYTIRQLFQQSKKSGKPKKASSIQTFSINQNRKTILLQRSMSILNPNQMKKTKVKKMKFTQITIHAQCQKV